MRSIVLVVPGPPGQRTGGYLYDEHLAEGLRRRGWAVDVLELDASFPHPTPAALGEAARAFAGLRAGTIAIVDSLALGAMPEVIIHNASCLRIVALLHLPLAATPGLDAATAARFDEGERRALHAAARVIVTGRATLDLIAGHGLPADRVVVVEPGTDRAPLARGSNGPRVELLSVATLTAGKGHACLLDAIAAVPETDWRLTCAGSLTRDHQTADRVRATIARLGLENRVELAGELDGPALEACYDRADLFVLATERETYGMAVAEALAHGLPVISTMTGAIPDLVSNNAGVVVPVGDTPALTNALSRVLGDRDLRARLGEGARVVRDRLPTWEEASARVATMLHAVVAHG